MQIGGFQKMTLVDYPGKIATTVFTVGCSFRCPFCHNPELVISQPLPSHPLFTGKGAEGEFFDFLKMRHGKLDGVCITGGEPTIQPDIVLFIEKIKEIGFAVKLDTNGTRPDVLKKLLDKKLLDYIAMDIKSDLRNYDKLTGSKVDKERIKLSVNLIMNSRVPYEFRTTVVPGLHAEKDFLAIAKWIGGAREYWLQEYREDFKVLDPGIKNITKGKKLDLEKIRKSIKSNFGKVGIRG